MPKALLLRLHRWIALAFALPLLVVIASGLVLALEPALKAATPDGTVTLPRLEAAIAAAGPGARNAALFVRGYDGSVTIGGRSGSATFNLATAEPTAPGALASVFQTTRRLHETLLLDLGWLVTASTIILVALAPLGLLLGWPRLRNTVGGWHRVTGWALLPLLVGSPLTGLALVFGISFATPVPVAGPAPPLLDVVRAVAATHDLDGLDFIRPIGGSRLVRVLDSGGTAVSYRVGADGLVPQPNNWPRVLHEGNWGGLLGSIANAVAAVALLGLLGTGLYIWLRRRVLLSRARAQRPVRAGAVMR